LLKKLIQEYRVELKKRNTPNEQENKKSDDYIEIRGTRGNNFFPMGSDIESDGLSFY